MKQIPDFKSEPERQKWFIANADYFTAISRINRQYLRQEFSCLAEAEAYAKQSLSEEPKLRSYLIYAVVNNSDVFVKSVLRNNDNQSAPGDNAERSVAPS